MTQATCSIITPLYSVIVLAVVVNRRAIHIGIRREGFFRWAQFVTAFVSVIGIVMSIIGVQLGGLPHIAAGVNWTVFGIAVTGLSVTLLALIVSSEIEEDADANEGGT